MANWKSIAVLGVGAVAVAGVVTYLYREFNKLYYSCYAIVGAIIHDFSLTNVRITLFIQIENTSDITVTVDKQFYDIFLNDMQVATFSSDTPMKLSSNSTKTFPVQVQFDPTDLLKKGVKNISGLIKNRENLEVKVKGVLSVKAGIARVDDLFIETGWTLKELTESDPDAVDVCEEFEKQRKTQKKKRA